MPTLQLGDQGYEVLHLQVMLTDLGYYAEADGDFGPNTEEQLRYFQMDSGLEPSGVLDASL